jgi:thymidylate synthase (FAD)
MKAWLVVEPKPAPELLEQGLEDAVDIIAYCARVSNPANEFNTETGERLIRKLIEWKHWSPLEMCSATIGIETTRDIARQMLRHRSFSFQEFSQRYADPTSLDNAFVLREARLQDPKNRQNSFDMDMERPYYRDIDREWRLKQERVIQVAKEAYEWAVSEGIGIAKEQARCVLPEGNTVSKLYMNGTLRSWVHYIELRSGNGTQKEHMEVARAIAQAISKIFPMVEEYVHG